MKFRDYFSIKHILFAVSLMAIMLIFAFSQSSNTVKVHFGDTQLEVTSAKYSLGIPYDVVESAQLADLPDAGERVQSCYDDGTLLAGLWCNDTWGEYHVVADPDASKCIVAHLNDGRTFVFSRKNNAATEEIYQQLLDRIA